MYIAVLFIHSWLRYFVLLFGIWLLVIAIRGWRAKAEWAPRHDRVYVRFLALLDLQLLLGLLLYFVLSPITATAFANMGAAMKDPQLRFFGVEHLLTMLIAVAVAHVGRARSKRKVGPSRYRTTLVMQAIWLVLTLISIPWPGLDIARPLFRVP
jgi:hypothetical protein